MSSKKVESINPVTGWYRVDKKFNFNGPVATRGSLQRVKDKILEVQGLPGLKKILAASQAVFTKALNLIASASGDPRWSELAIMIDKQVGMIETNALNVVRMNMVEQSARANKIAANSRR